MIDETVEVESGETFELSPWRSLTSETQTTAIAIMVGSFIVVLLLAILLAAKMNSATSTPSYEGTGPTYTPNTDNAAVQPSDNSQPGALPGDNSTPADTGTPTPTGEGATQAAVIDRLLQQAKSDRQGVSTAVNDLESCGSGSGLTADIAEIDQVAGDRDQLATQASQADVSQVTGGQAAVRQLVTALRDSAQADREFSAWGHDLSNRCNSSAATKNTHYKNAMTASGTATSDKNAFVSSWNAIAQTYGLTQVAESDF